MKVGLVTICYNEERMIKPFLTHIPDWVDEKLVLVSAKPWFGKYELPDKTDEIAREMGATVIVHDWATEEEQRNAGQEYLSDYDWIIVLDPDEFLDNKNWKLLKQTLEDIDYSELEALVVSGQWTYYKDGVADPPADYQMLIAVKPWVRFVDKRVVNVPFAVAPIWLHHMSWRKTDEEVWSKITHYAHAHDFDTEKWFNEVWKSDKRENVHPTSPSTLARIIPAKLPPELEKLGL